MTVTGGIAAGMAYLPNWLVDNRDPATLNALLAGWAQASGWRAAGLVWPVETKPRVALVARENGTDTLTQLPAEVPDVAESLQSGTPTVVWQLPNTSGRLYALLTPAGRPSGVIWAERHDSEAWTEIERNYLRLSARLIERSGALAATTGPTLDPERLNQRLQDASVVAGRIAHDFDNILTGIIGFADLATPLLQAGSQPAKFVGEISKVGMRGITFTQQLHQLSRSGQTKPQPALLSSAIQKEEQRLKPRMPAGLRVQMDVPTNLAAVSVDATPLQQVVGHLLENAIEASPANGLVTVSARQVELNATDARLYLGKVGPGAHVELTIQDSGPGIKPEVRSRLFVEPFYTTKVRHRGLGLAIVYRILFAHRGGISIDAVATPPETGTLVRVVIPLAAARPAVNSAFTVGTPFFGG